MLPGGWGANVILSLQMAATLLDRSVSIKQKKAFCLGCQQLPTEIKINWKFQRVDFFYCNCKIGALTTRKRCFTHVQMKPKVNLQNTEMGALTYVMILT